MELGAWSEAMSTRGGILSVLVALLAVRLYNHVRPTGLNAIISSRDHAHLQCRGSASTRCGGGTVQCARQLC